MSNCLCSPSEILLYPCSGVANVGQIANEAAVKISGEGKAKMLCLAGIAANIPGIVDPTKQAKKIIVVDGCPVACAKKIMENAGFNIDEYILVTEEGIDKTPGKSEYTSEEMNKIRGLIEQKI